MRKIIIIFLILLMVAISAISTACPCVCKPALVGSLAVPLHPQETSNWCWAASGQMVMDYLGHSVSQCAQANHLFSRTDCCTIDLCPVPTEAPQYDTLGNCIGCACGGWPEFGNWGFNSTRTSDKALTWDQVKNEISNEPCCSKRPFTFTWHWPGGGGHTMVAKGYLSLSGVNYVVMLDPWSPCVGDETIITYDFYNTASTHHTHWDDFYEITYVGD